MAFLFENLQVYQKAVELADKIVCLTENFPRGYHFLADQLDRATLSVAANLAEGNGRFTKADRKNFFPIARGSAQECAPLLEGAAVACCCMCIRRQRTQDGIGCVSLDIQEISVKRSAEVEYTERQRQTLVMPRWSVCDDGWMRAFKCLTISGLWAGMLMLVTGCASGPDCEHANSQSMSTSTVAFEEPASRSPRATIEAMRVAAAEGDYRRMVALCHPELRLAVSEFLQWDKQRRMADIEVPNVRDWREDLNRDGLVSVVKRDSNVTTARIGEEGRQMLLRRHGDIWYWAIYEDIEDARHVLYLQTELIRRALGEKPREYEYYQQLERTPAQRAPDGPGMATARAADTLRGVEQKADHWLYVPVDYRDDRPAPLLVVCHSTPPFGAAETEIKRWKHSADEHGCIILVPVRPRSTAHLGDKNVEFVKEHVQALVRLVAATKRRYNIDGDRLMLAGSAGGGPVMYRTAVNHLELFSKVAALGCLFDVEGMRELEVPAGDETLPLMVCWSEASPAIVAEGSRAAAAFWARRKLGPVETSVLESPRPDACLNAADAYLFGTTRSSE